MGCNHRYPTGVLRDIFTIHRHAICFRDLTQAAVARYSAWLWAAYLVTKSLARFSLRLSETDTIIGLAP